MLAMKELGNEKKSHMSLEIEKNNNKKIQFVRFIHHEHMHNFEKSLGNVELNKKIQHFMLRE